MLVDLRWPHAKKCICQNWLCTSQNTRRCASLAK